MFRNNCIVLLLILLVFLFSGCVTFPPQPQVIRPEGIYHIVGSGQTLYRISQTYGVDIKELMRLNNIPDPAKIGVGEKLFIPHVKTPLPVEPYRPLKLESIEKLVGKRNPFAKWKYITLHHSATLEGNAEAFDRNHRKLRLGGLFYHFVIGNGSGSSDGEVEVGWRWRRQLEVERPYDIQICLIGDFNQQYISQAQFNSLIKLISILRKHYNISLNNIREHKDIRGKITECPGEKFPFYKLLAELRKS